FSARLDALARVQGLLSHADGQGITLLALLRLELDALGLAWEARVTLQGPAVVLRRSMVQTLALALHELATNTRKYGAFTTETGHLDVTWDVHDNGKRLALLWRE
ncbi:HWE histidine kinase domain-containing protein, partial [Stenotrophomonas sp. A3_2]|uniref:HWE histidine kinase domain-containing protein n=1 Tax=Stenotrophomonas sp. A3_2 TaxID=3119978 RepID=UPI002FC28EA7